MNRLRSPSINRRLRSRHCFRESAGSGELRVAERVADTSLRPCACTIAPRATPWWDHVGAMIEGIVPRWEWRTFEPFGDAERRLAALAAAPAAASDEMYVLALAS